MTVTESPYKILRKNQRLLVEELVRRGVEVTVLVKELELVEARYRNHYELILDRDSSISPYSTSIICGEKYLTKKLLERAGLSVPAGEQFFPDQMRDALRYAESLRRPLVVKPASGSGGSGCHMDLEQSAEIEEAVDKVVSMVGRERAFLIEEQRPGQEYRVFVTENGNYAVLQRDPAYVIGDGEHTIKELAEAETYRRMNPHTTCLCPILLDEMVVRFLARFGQTLQSVPGKGSKIYLRGTSNVGLGGDCEDYTEKVHPSFVQIAFAALRAFHGLKYAGVDILSTDATREQSPGTYSVLEINSNPGLNMHVNPGRGEPRNVVSYLADLIFPETKV